MLLLISYTALAVSVMFVANASPTCCICSASLPTIFTDDAIFSMVLLKKTARSVISSLPSRGSRTVKSPSPSEISFNASTAFLIGLTILPATITTTVIVRIKMITPITVISFFKTVIVAKNSSTGAVTITVQPVVSIFAYEAISLSPSYV